MFDTRLYEAWKPSQTERSRVLVDRMCTAWRAEAQAAADRLDATKEPHPHARELCKVALLGMAYGMQPPTSSIRTGLSLLEARDLLAWMRQTFPDLAQWSDDSADTVSSPEL